MASHLLSSEDLQQIREHGLEPDEVLRQISLFREGLPPTRLVRCCTVGDGIRRFDIQRIESLAAEYADLVKESRVVKFVPASGAASRMFRSLIRMSSRIRGSEPVDSGAAARSGDADERACAEFFSNLKKFAFYPDLKKEMARRGLDPEAEAAAGRWGSVLAALLEPSGLNYADVPKGLVKFHSYPGHSRTAFEEHILEALAYARGRDGLSRLHFTVAEEYEPEIRAFIEKQRRRYEKGGRKCEVGYSCQSPATDTIAVDLENRPFRDENGRLIFRPGGHGALLDNLARLEAEFVFLKNVDNVVPDHRKPETFLYRTALAAHLFHLQTRLHDLVLGLTENPGDKRVVARAREFAMEELGLPQPPDRGDRPLRERAHDWINRLNRPLRVCAMVSNQGEPGGGPFWVRDRSGELAAQIVEEPQVDRQNPGQWAIYTSSTHFNPTDMACTLRDFRGRPFSLTDFVDQNAAFITRKSHEGRALKALERPGLWNGSMAGWISVFVEVPLTVFNPVKTVFALLRDGHQPPAKTSPGAVESD